jgi:hypothetical protein
MDRLDETTWVVWIAGVSMFIGSVSPWFRYKSWGSGIGSVIHWVVLLFGLGVAIWAGLRAFDVVQESAIPVSDAVIYWLAAGLSLLILILNPVMSGFASYTGHMLLLDAVSIGFFFTLFGIIALAIGGYLSFTEYRSDKGSFGQLAPALGQWPQQSIVQPVVSETAPAPSGEEVGASTAVAPVATAGGVPSQQAPTSKPCLSCGQSVDANLRFCNYCGQPMS